VGFCGGNKRWRQGRQKGTGGKRRRRDCRSTRLALRGAESGGVLADLLWWARVKRARTQPQWCDARVNRAGL
jgi:hypothetical protein